MNTKIYLPISKPDISNKEFNLLKKSFSDGWISSQSPYIEKFEKKFSSMVSMKYGVSTSNGTTALELALKSLDIKNNDEVIIPALTFGAVCNAVLNIGAVPVLIDVNYHDWNIDINEIKKNITPKTKAIIAVHSFGVPCQINLIKKICISKKIFLIEDCAEAHFSKIDGKIVGSFGDISCFSFFANKIITTGEGGICLTNSKKISDKLKIIRDHGMSKKKKYFYILQGTNSRMTSLQASIGIAQLSKFKKILKWRHEQKNYYDEHLLGSKYIDKNVYGSCTFCRCKNSNNIKCVNWLYSLLCKKPSMRNQLIKKAKLIGIDFRPFFRSLDSIPIFQKKCKIPKKCLVSQDLASRGINLPTFKNLTKKNLDQIISIFY